MAKVTLAAKVLERLALHGPQYTRQLVAALETQPECVRQVCSCLRKKGLIHSEDGMHGLTRLGEETLGKGLEPPCRLKGQAASSKGRTLRQRAWSVMRMADHFTVDSLLQTVSDGDEKYAEGNLRYYCRALLQAGFLGQTARTRAYFLRPEANTGPLAPAYNREGKCVTDRNTGKTYPLEAAHA